MANHARLPWVQITPAAPETSPDLGGHPGSCDPHIVQRHSTPKLAPCVYARAKSARPLQSKKPCCNLLQGSTLTTHERCSYSFSFPYDFIPEFIQGSLSNSHSIVVIILAAYAQQIIIRLPKFHLQGCLCNKHPNFRVCNSGILRPNILGYTSPYVFPLLAVHLWSLYNFCDSLLHHSTRPVRMAATNPTNNFVAPLAEDLDFTFSTEDKDLSSAVSAYSANSTVSNSGMQKLLAKEF